MRILHVVPTYVPAVRYGGPIYSVHALCRALVARGHDVHVHTTNVDGPGVSNVSLTEAASIDGVTVRYFSCGWGRRLYRSPEMGRAFVAHIVEFDILHLHSVFLWPTFAAARVARRADVPYILAPRGMLVADLVARKSRILKSAWISLFEHTNVAGAAAIHVTSELEAAEFEKFGFPVRRMVVVMNGVEAPAVTQPERHPNVAREPYVLGLGRINWKKGFDRLIAAMAYVPNANLIIAGNDEEGYQPALERMIRDLNLSGRVRFLGPVYNDAKWNLLKSAALFALPSHSENFGIASTRGDGLWLPGGSDAGGWSCRRHWQSRRGFSRRRRAKAIWHGARGAARTAGASPPHGGSSERG